MKKVIKLTESDLTRIVKRVLKENFMEERDYDYIMGILSNDGLHPT
jgi:intein-encoded DNA endonuclease-like protein